MDRPVYVDITALPPDEELGPGKATKEMVEVMRAFGAFEPIRITPVPGTGERRFNVINGAAIVRAARIAFMDHVGPTRLWALYDAPVVVEGKWVTWPGVTKVHWAENGVTLCGFPREFRTAIIPSPDEVCHTCRVVLDGRK